MINKRNFNRLIKDIETYPQNFNMDWYFVDNDSFKFCHDMTEPSQERTDFKNHKTGTTACIAGRALLLMRPQGDGASNNLERWLGLPIGVGTWLISGSFKETTDRDTHLDKITAEEAIKALTYLMNGGDPKDYLG